MKEQNERNEERKKPRVSRERRFYLITALACALILTAIIGVTVALSGTEATQNTVGGNNGGNQTVLPPDDNSGNQGNPDDGKDDEQVIVTPQGMVMPIRSVSVSNDYGFYYNQSVNAYYRHAGVDFSAEAGTEVMAIDGGVVKSITSDALLKGTEIVIDHGDGLQSVYRFVTALESLRVGDSVAKGEVIATVAEACGNEYKDGPHLHLEILENGKSVDPNLHLTLEEK